MTNGILCARCGKPVPRHRYSWFSHEVDLDGEGKVMVVFKVEVRRPRHARLCLRCMGDLIASGGAAMHAKLVELDHMARHPK